MPKYEYEPPASRVSTVSTTVPPLSVVLVVLTEKPDAQTTGVVTTTVMSPVRTPPPEAERVATAGPSVNDPACTPSRGTWGSPAVPLRRGRQGM